MWSNIFFFISNCKEIKLTNAAPEKQYIWVKVDKVNVLINKRYVLRLIGNHSVPGMNFYQPKLLCWISI